MSIDVMIQQQSNWPRYGICPQQEESWRESENKEAIQFIKVKMANNFLNFSLTGFYNIFFIEILFLFNLAMFTRRRKILGNE